MKRKYEKISKVHYLDLQTYKIVIASQRKSPNVCYLPPIFESIADRVPAGLDIFKGKISDSSNVEERASSFRLNNIDITNNKGVDYVKFFDHRKKQRHLVTFKENQIVVAGTSLLVDFDVTFDDGMKGYAITIDDIYKKYQKIGNLVHSAITTDKKKQPSFNYGLLGSEFNILYKGHNLGSCYCYINKWWGILLTDDLFLDALFIIDEQRSNIITVNQFLYTTNSYLCKCIVLY